MADTIFGRIVDGRLPSHRVWEDADLLAILDIEPVNKGHALILTKVPYVDCRQVPDRILQKVLPLARDLGAAMCEEFGYSGFNVHQSNGPDAGQDILHYHLHVWPRTSDGELTLAFRDEVQYAPGEIENFAERLALAVKARLGS